ncbi:MAG: hypothetical protein J4G05_03485 [Chlorobi bacterium]|nr:hypothetical protein [Chlorobiota bacterium]
MEKQAKKGMSSDRKLVHVVPGIDREILEQLYEQLEQTLPEETPLLRSRLATHAIVIVSQFLEYPPETEELSHITIEALPSNYFDIRYKTEFLRRIRIENFDHQEFGEYMV